MALSFYRNIETYSNMTFAFVNWCVQIPIGSDHCPKTRQLFSPNTVAI